MTRIMHRLFGLVAALIVLTALGVDAPAKPGPGGGEPKTWIFPEPTDALKNITALYRSGRTTEGTSSVSRTFAQNEMPDLDLGYKDFIDVRMKVAPGFAGDLELRYVTADTPEAGTSRLVKLPGNALKPDGQFRFYRIDLGLEVWWRGFLKEFALAAAPGAPADKVIFERVLLGDFPNDQGLEIEYEPSALTLTVKPVGEGEGNADQKNHVRAESKHFAVHVSDLSFERGWKEDWIRGNLRSAEEIWQVYTKILKMYPPGKIRNQKNHKIDILTWNNAFHGGDWGVSLAPAGLLPDPPSWALAHELCHTFQSLQGAGVPQPRDWHEAHCNYCREVFLTHFSPVFGKPQSGSELYYTELTFLFLPHGSFYYGCFPIFRYLDENPDNLPGLGFGTVSDLYKQGTEDDTDLFERVLRYAPKIDLKDAVGRYARRNVNWDYENHDAIMARETNDGKLEPGWFCIPLYSVPDRPDWLRPPAAKTPMQYAYIVHKLIPDAGSRSVTVTFSGFDIPDRQEDWRVSFVAVEKDGSSRYSDLWSNGPMTFALKDDDQQLYLSVAATPTDNIQGSQDGGIYEYFTHPHRRRFAYELKIDGAKPAPIKVEPVPEGGKRHANGGGFVADSAKVDETAYVGPNARVLDTAQVLGEARIEDYAVIAGKAIVKDRAIISGYARVGADATVEGNARVRNHARVGQAQGAPVVKDQARVLDFGLIDNSAVIRDSATIEGIATACGRKPEDGQFGGTTVLGGDGWMETVVTDGFFSGRQPWSWKPRWADNYLNHPMPGLYAEFTFDRDMGYMAKDTYGASDGILRGKPEWVQEFEGRKGVLKLNGSDQHVLLTASCSDLTDFTVSLWFYPLSDAPQSLLAFNGSDKRYARLNLFDKLGGIAFTLADGDWIETLSTEQKPRLNAWQHVAISQKDGETTLYLDGKATATIKSNIRLCRLSAPGTQNEVQQNSLGWDGDARRFNGYVDSFKVLVTAFDEDGLLGIMSDTRSQVVATQADEPASERNVARRASVSAGSSAGNGKAEYAVDGLIERGDANWTTEAEPDGAYISLTWPEPVTVDRVCLFNGSGRRSQITSGQLEFPEGPLIRVGALPNDPNAQCTEVTFPQVTTKSMVYRITDKRSESGQVGLSEIAVFGPESK